MSVDHKLYVGNLADDITATALRQRFEQVGRVADVELGIDRASGRMRGFAFVTMATDAAAQAAIAGMNGKSIEGRPLVVNEARPAPAGDRPPRGPGGGGGFRGPRSGGGGGGGGYGGGGGGRGGYGGGNY